MKTNTIKSVVALFLAVLMAMPSALAEGEPTNVAGVSANATGSSTINLSWNSAQAAGGGLVDHYRIYYGNKSVQGGEALEYLTEVNTPNNNTSFLLSELSPATTYYFAVTAVDAEGIESEEYSVETNATTQAATGGDTIPPLVMSAVALDKTHVTIKFSEKVKLPALIPEAAFSITEQISPANTLEVLSATIYTGDPTEKIILLETAEQTKNMNYVVTASVAITDTAGNPIVSGSTDSGLFAGSDKAPEAIPVGTGGTTDEETEGGDGVENTPEGDTTATPVVLPLNAQAVDCGVVNEDAPTSADEIIKGCFEAKFQTCSPALYTKTTGTGPTLVSYKYEIIAAINGACQVRSHYSNHINPEWANKTMSCEYNHTKVFAEAEKEVLDSFSLPQKKGACQGELYALLIASQAASELLDVTPPEEITNLILSFKQQVNGFMVLLNWTASINTAQDLIDQMLYQSADRGGTYDNGKSLGASATNTSVAGLQAGKEYTFKITTKDAAGNESVGVVKSIRLPQTGVGAGLLLLGSVLGARHALRRKRK